MTNMYPGVDTRNFIGGKCLHKCTYCYVPKLRFPAIKKRYSGALHLIEKEFKKTLGKNKTMFIGSCNDMFAKEVPKEWIIKVLDYCGKFDNTYLFQTKNPLRFLELWTHFPKKTILGTTLETNRHYEKISKACSPEDRLEHMKILKANCCREFDMMISVEPVMDFDLPVFTTWFYQLRPKFVSIGADSKSSSLKEPSPEKLKLFINELEKVTEVRIKSNLKRLLEV